MNDIDILAAFIARERPGARLVRDMSLPDGSVVALTAVETGRLAGFLTWEEDRPMGRVLRATRESVKHLHETWVVTSLMGARLLKGEVPGEVGLRVLREGTTQPGVAHPATVMSPPVPQLVELLTREERLEIAGKLGVSDAILAVAAGGQLKWDRPSSATCWWTRSESVTPVIRWRPRRRPRSYWRRSRAPS